MPAREMPRTDGGTTEQFLCRGARLADHPPLLYRAGRTGGSGRRPRSSRRAHECRPGERHAPHTRQGGRHPAKPPASLNCGRPRSILRQLWLYLVDICKDTALQVIQIRKPEFLLQFADSLRAAATYLAMHDDLPVPLDAVTIRSHRRQGDQLRPDVDDLVFMRLADIDQLEGLTGHLPVI